MFRPKSSVTSLAGRFTPLGAKDRKNLRQQFLAQFKSQSSEHFDLICPLNAPLSVYSVKGVTCDIYVSDSVPLFITHSSKKKSAILTPTVFALWKLPNLLPRMLCQEPAFGYISRGADFMIPGLVNRAQITTYTATDGAQRLPNPRVRKTIPLEPCLEGDVQEPSAATKTAPEDEAKSKGCDHGDADSSSAAAAEDRVETQASTATDHLSPEVEYPLACLEEGQLWALACVGHEKPFAVGEAAMDFDQFQSAEKGKVLVVTHVVGDLLYKMCPQNKFEIPQEFRVVGDPALEALVSVTAGEASEPPPSEPPAGKGKRKDVIPKGAPVSPPLKQTNAYQPLNNVKDILANEENGQKKFFTAADVAALFAKLMTRTYTKSLEFPSIGVGDAAPPPPPDSLPSYAEICRRDGALNNLCLTKKERKAFKDGESGAALSNAHVLQTFIAQGFKKLTILAPEGSTDVQDGAMVVEGDAAITISVKRTKRFVRTQVANIHKFSSIEPKQLAERLQKACAAAATVAEMEDLKGNPLGVLVQGSVPQDCQKFIHKTYGIPMDMIVIS